MGGKNRRTAELDATRKTVTNIGTKGMGQPYRGEGRGPVSVKHYTK